MNLRATPRSVPTLDPSPAPSRAGSVLPEAVRALDRHAISQLGIPGEVLMENAAAALARSALALTSGQILVLAGAGNNGGDGLATHRLLFPRSQLLLVSQATRLKGLAETQWRILERSSLPACEDPQGLQAQAVLATLGSSDLVIDALLGTGLDRDVAGPLKGVIEAINASRGHVLAADIPSGLHGGDGRILGAAVRAEVTVTFAATKRGLYTGSGPECAGSIYLAGIGIPAAARDAFLAAWR